MKKNRRAKSAAIGQSLAPIIEALENRCLLCTPTGPFPTPLPAMPFPSSEGQKHPLNSLPQLSSYPAGTATLFLDFDGGDPMGQDPFAPTPAYDHDGDPM